MTAKAHLCVVTFNRYDLLERLLKSVSGQPVAKLWVIDRGMRPDLVEDAWLRSGLRCDLAQVLSDGQSLPAAWNWFAVNVPEDRIIASDDVEFGPTGVAEFLACPAPIAGITDGKSSQFACFMIRDECVEGVGLFDEWLSPNYMYFEDCDYARRMKLVGVTMGEIHGLAHEPGRSWEKKTEAQRNEHHQKFLFAEANYLRKWGGKPGQETLAEPRDYERTGICHRGCAMMTGNMWCPDCQGSGLTFGAVGAAQS